MRYKTSRVQNYLPMTSFVRQTRSNEYQYRKILYFKAYKYPIIKRNLTVSKRELTPTFKKVQSLASCLWLKEEKQFLAITSRAHLHLLLIRTGKLLIERATTHLPSRPSLPEPQSACHMGLYAAHRGLSSLTRVSKQSQPGPKPQTRSRGRSGDV